MASGPPRYHQDITLQNAQRVAPNFCTLGITGQGANLQFSYDSDIFRSHVQKIQEYDDQMNEYDIHYDPLINAHYDLDSS